MNKLSVYSLSALVAFGFVACDNYEEPNPAGQINEQGAILSADQVSVSNSIVEGTYSLEEYAGTSINLATVTTPDLGDYYTIAAETEVSADGFAKVIPVESAVAAGETAGVYTITVAAQDLQDAYYANISKGPKAKDVEFRYTIYVASNGAGGVQKSRVGTFGPYKMNVLPMPSDLVIEDAYYLVGTANDWSVANGIKLNHDPNVSVYDDPVFSYKFDVTEGGWWWKIVPESVYVTGEWGSGPNSQFGPEENGDESFAGLLTTVSADGTEPGAGCLQAAGPYLLTINMEEMTYSFDLAIENLYTPGNSNGWSQGSSQMLMTDDYSNYYGFAHLNGEFKFTSQADWNGINYGASDEEGKLSTDGGAGNLSTPADGLYYCKVNIASLAYSLYQVNTIGIIGDATPNGWDASTALTPSADFLVWTGTVTLTSGEFKFRANDAWDVNLGGDVNDLRPDGANIPSPGAGTYTITLDLSTLPYTCTVQ